MRGWAREAGARGSAVGFPVGSAETAITFDPAKRDRTRAERGLDFEDAGEVFARPVFEFEDDRRAYGERRIVTVGFVAGRMTIVIWTPRGADRHVISMRKANVREQRRYAPLDP